MAPAWEFAVVSVLRTINQILAAGIAITAFSLLLYALTFNLRDRVARSFAFIMLCVVIVFAADGVGSSASDGSLITLMLRVQWVGIMLLPATYLAFSDALLATTGRPSRGRRSLLVRLSFIASILFLISLPTDSFSGKIILTQEPAPHFEPTPLVEVFTAYYLTMMALSWSFFVRAFRRTRTSASRRRMGYLLVGAAAPALGSYPFLLFGSGFATQHQLIFWAVASITNLLVGLLIVIMAYAVAFFGVPWPDRVVRIRLFKWLMRGPVTASIALGLMTIVRRFGESFGTPYSGFVPITMVVTVVLFEYFITLFSPYAERWLFGGGDQEDLTLLRDLEERLLTRHDLSQYLEMVLSAVCDRLQAPGAYVVAVNEHGPSLIVRTGKTSFAGSDLPDDFLELLAENGLEDHPFQWNQDILLPIHEQAESGIKTWLGVVGISDTHLNEEDEEQQQTLRLLARRTAFALRDLYTQQQVFQSLRNLSPQVDLIQRIRAAGQYHENNVLMNDLSLVEEDVNGWVKDALNHYWGGPKLTESPLLQFQRIQNAVPQHEGSPANALRATLKEAIELLKPEGEKRYTSEWLLYNILDMKYIEGRKVREIANRLAISEADFYRKQRVAIEAVAKLILDQESQARSQVDAAG